MGTNDSFEQKKIRLKTKLIEWGDKCTERWLPEGLKILKTVRISIIVAITTFVIFAFGILLLLGYWVVVR